MFDALLLDFTLSVVSRVLVLQHEAARKNQLPSCLKQMKPLQFLFLSVLFGFNF